MHRHAVFSSLHRGKALAVSATATLEERLAWVGVYPLNLANPLTREFLRNQGIQIVPSEGRAYRVRTFEVRRQVVDADISIAERELENATSVIVFDDDALVSELNRLGVALESLELPYKSGYPI